MPGITGFFTKEFSRDAEQTLASMVSAMAKAPHDASGQLLEPRVGAAVGWTCHRGSFSDPQPLWNASHDICLIFVGEDFSGTETPRPGSRTPTDARYLLERYEALGDSFFESLNGSFSGVVLDTRRGRAFVFNDRFGLHRIYHHSTPDGFYFSSEAKSLLRVLPRLRKPDWKAWGEFFTCGGTLQGRSLFEGISILPPASAWRSESGSITPHTYFDRRSWESLPPLPPEDYYAQLKAIYPGILAKYLAGKETVGLSLTGGLDSRMILAWLPRDGYTLPCYTFGGMYRECADVTIARKVAALCGQPYQVLPMTDAFFKDFPELAVRSVVATDGALDVTGAINLFTNRAARGLAPVRLTGNYGSEVLRANVAFRAGMPNDTFFNADFNTHLKAGFETFRQERAASPSKISFIAFKQVPWHHYNRYAVESSELTVRSPFLDNELVRLSFQAPVDVEINKQLSHRLISDGNRELDTIPTDRGNVGRMKWMPTRMRNWCAEFMPRAEYVYDYGMPHWMAKVDRVLSPLHIEKLFLGQQKYFHFRLWYRHQLAPFIQEYLLDSRTLSRSYLNAAEVRRMVESHVTGRGNYTIQIHKLLGCEILHRHLIDPS